MLVFELIVAEILGRRERKSNLESYENLGVWYQGRKMCGTRHPQEALCSIGQRARGAEEYDLLSVLRQGYEWIMKLAFCCWFFGAVWAQESPEPHFSLSCKGPNHLHFCVRDMVVEFLPGIWAPHSWVTSNFGWAGGDLETTPSWRGWEELQSALGPSAPLV